MTCDLRDSAQIAKTVEKIDSIHKGIYGLVNNAGIYPFGGIADTTEAAWDEAMDVNLKAPFLLIQAVAKIMAKNGDGGRIVNVPSTAGMLPNHFAMAYSVSKAALIHLSRTLAKELGKDNITVNCVCPGIVRSPLHEAYHPSKSELEEFYAKRGAAFPLGRVGEPKDVAGAVKFFLGPDSAWVTGDVFVVDGGRLLL
jgi:NAD(P)-dependent dehydrogenase (short-subunit alcohol dehydrogenase family)